MMFKEMPGGIIASLPTGKTVVRIEVENLTTDEAREIMAAVLSALEAMATDAPQVG